MRLALKACEAIGIERERVRDDLQRDVATELRIARAIDLAHAAGAERRQDFVRAEACASGQAHAYFLSPAAQFSTTAIGIVRPAVSPDGGCGIRKRCPSAETANE